MDAAHEEARQLSDAQQSLKEAVAVVELVGTPEAVEAVELARKWVLVLGERRVRPESVNRVADRGRKHPAPGEPHLAGLRASPVEVLGVLTLDARLALLGDLWPVASGSIMHVAVSAREVFAPALERRAVAIVLAHNHPTGDPEPSADDWAFAQLMTRAGAILGIQILDHIIVARRGYFSFAAARLLSPSPASR
jgi:DNA repair protein RadC